MTSTRYIVRDDGPNRYGVDFWSVLDTATGEVRATWTVGHYAVSQCAWLNAHASAQPPTAPYPTEATS